MKIVVNRLVQTGDDTISAVEVNGRLKYYGLEPLNCIAQGTYKVTAYKSPSHGFMVPLVNNVPGHAGIEIHVVNTVKDTKDCLGLSNNILNEEFIQNSSAAIKEFYADFFTAIAAKEPVTITYNNLFPKKA